MAFYSQHQCTKEIAGIQGPSLNPNSKMQSWPTKNCLSRSCSKWLFKATRWDGPTSYWFIAAKSPLEATWWDSLDAWVTGSHVSAPESWIPWHPHLTRLPRYHDTKDSSSPRDRYSNSHCIKPMLRMRRTKEEDDDERFSKSGHISLSEVFGCPHVQSAILASTTSHWSPPKRETVAPLSWQNLVRPSITIHHHITTSAPSLFFKPI